VTILAALTLVALAAGFLDAIAGGGGLITVPALALAGLDPVAVVATNKLGGTFGSGSSTLFFARAGLIDFRAMGPSAVAAGIGSVIGALALPLAPRDALNAALPLILVAVALYFAFTPSFGERDRKNRMSPRAYSLTIAPLVGFYDGIFGPGAGSFYMIGMIALLGFAATRAVAHARLANFASNFGALVVFVVGGHVLFVTGFAMGAGQFVGSRLGARAVIGGGARLVRPMIVVISCLMAARLLMSPGNPARAWIIHALPGAFGG
jgi:uncharacterized membrane protein YfcA